MNNIFENAYFGKSYKTKDGRKAVFYNHHNGSARARANYVTMILEGQESIYRWYYNGVAAEHQEHLDIVSEWQEEPFGNTSNAKLKFGDAKHLIDEEELEEIAHKYVNESTMSGLSFDGYDTYNVWSEDDIASAYIAGYRKALKQ